MDMKNLNVSFARSLFTLIFLMIPTDCRFQTHTHSNIKRYSASDFGISPQVGDTLEDDLHDSYVIKDTDTFLLFEYRSQRYRVIADKSQVSQFAGFQEFLNASQDDSLHFVVSELADVTGDGLPDSCVGSITISRNRKSIENTVLSKGKKIYADSLSIGEWVMNLDWEADDFSYTSLEPASILFACRGMARFVADTINIKSEEYKNFIETRKSDVRRWETYLSRSRPHAIWNLRRVSNGLLVWDTKSKAFITYWGP